MNQDQLIAWINTLSLSSANKDKIINGIKQCAEENSDPVTGSDFIEADVEDIKELTAEAIGTKLAKSLLAEVSKKKDEDFTAQSSNNISNNNNSNNLNINNGPFTLNLIAQQGGIVQIKNVTKSWTVSKIKAEYLEDQGNCIAADKYRRDVKWSGTEGKIDLLKSGKVMKNEYTLEYYKIICAADCIMPLTVMFKCKGGAEAKYNDNNEDDKYKVRKLRRKKYKGMIKLSKKPDCIMGYTDDDNVRRAEMPCGCAIASDTMWRYMKALFEKDFKGTKLICPMPNNLCTGNNKQREWPWNLIYIIADLSQKEIAKYSRIITNRTAGTKNCPHCGATTERPKELRICRVACKQCKNSDWCWNCTKTWKSGGLGPICGNKDCMGAEVNNILKQCDWIVPTAWGSDINKSSLTCPGKEGKVPKVRACPKCCSMIQYTSACKHMWCLCCPHEFCFNCLGTWDKDGNGQCKHGKSCNLYKSSDGQYQQVFT